MRIGNPVNGRLHNVCSGETHCFQQFIYSKWGILILLWLEWPEGLESKGLWGRPRFLKELGYLPTRSIRDNRWQWNWGLSMWFLHWAQSSQISRTFKTLWYPQFLACFPRRASFLVSILSAQCPCICGLRVSVCCPGPVVSIVYPCCSTEHRKVVKKCGKVERKLSGV